MSASHSTCPQCGTAISDADRKTRRQCANCGRPFNFVVARMRTETLSLPAMIPGLPTEPPPPAVDADSIEEVPEAAAVADEAPAEEPIVEALSVEEPVAEVVRAAAPPPSRAVPVAPPRAAVEAPPARGPFEGAPPKPAPAPEPVPVPAAKAPVEEVPQPVPESMFAFTEGAPAEDDAEADEGAPVLRSKRRNRDEDDDRRDRRRDRDRREPSRRDPKKKDSGAKVAIIAIVGAVALVGMAIGGYLVFSNPSKPNKDEVKNTTPPVGVTPPQPKKDDKKGKDATNLTPEQVIKKVKDSTVYIRVHMPGGGLASGSGFFAGKAGYVVTNAHVVGYGPYRIQKPEKVEVVVDSGEPAERRVVAKIFGLDAEHDLAVLQVAMKDMPPPLPFGKAESLIETQEVIIFGYPLGETLATNVSVNRTTVSRLQKANGSIDKVQLAGGLNSGNSGGPVTNTKGEVIGVSVSVIRNAEGIGFAIPAERTQSFVEDMDACGGQIRVPKWLEDFNAKIDSALVPKHGWPTLRIPAPKPATITPAKIDGDSAPVKLSSPADGACVGGGGRFVIFHLPDENRLAVLDVCAAKVVKTLAAPDKALFAASMDALYVVDAGNEKIERWSLTTFAKEGSMPLPVTSGLTAKAVAIGSASNGPLMVQAQSGGRLSERFLFDVVLGREIKGSRKLILRTDRESGDRLRASADGRTFVCTHPDGRSEAIVVTDTGYHEAKAPESREGSFAAVSGDGQWIYAAGSTGGRGGLLSGPALGGGAPLPAVHGPLVLVPTVAKGAIAVHVGRERKPLFELPSMPALDAVLSNKRVLHPDQHVFFVPAAKALAVLSPDGDSVTLHKLDPDALLDATEDYLFVTSTPPQASAGKTFDYRLAVKSKKPATGFQVLSGPPGMVVSDDGRLTWTVPAKFTDAAKVAVAITGADGKEHRHEFEVIPTLPPPD